MIEIEFTNFFEDFRNAIIPNSVGVLILLFEPKFRGLMAFFGDYWSENFLLFSWREISKLSRSMTFVNRVEDVESIGDMNSFTSPFWIRGPTLSSRISKDQSSIWISNIFIRWRSHDEMTFAGMLLLILWCSSKNSMIIFSFKL